MMDNLYREAGAAEILRVREEGRAFLVIARPA
jgi:hypothetical protein